MKRRQFIWDTTQSLALFMLSPSLLTCCNQDDESIVPNGKTAIVIGAGISGLAAAQSLQQAGFTVTVLEAQDKAGGRIRTNRSLGIAFDEGASWIHGPKRNPISDLATEAGARTFVTDDNSVIVFDSDGTPYSDRTLSRAENDFYNAIQAVLDAGNQNQSFQTVFNSLYPNQSQNRLWKYMLSAYLEFSIGGDLSDISSQYFYDDEAFSGADQIITNGYDQITDYLAAGLNLKYNTPVSFVDYTNEKVMVSTQTDSFDCDYLVVTVPLGVLKSNTITFSPELPTDKTNAIHQTQMGNVNKFLLTWETPFWDTSLQYIGYTPETKGKFNYFLNAAKFSPYPALITFAFGDYATTTENMSDEEVINEIMTHLRRIYGPAIPSPTHLLRTKWGQNPHAYGAYSFATNGTTSNDFSTLAQSVNDKLFFAGEHTSRDYRGTVHGAYLSGIRAADNIIHL